MVLVKSASSLTLSSFDRSLHVGAGCDLTRLKFVDVFGLVGCALALSEATARGGVVGFRGPASLPTADHLVYMGLPDILGQLGVASDLVESPSANFPDVVLTVKTLQTMSVVEEISHLLYAQLDQRVHAQVLVAVTEALWEIAANAIEHSGASAFVAAQVYRGGEAPDHDDRVQIAIGDGGCGIRESFLKTGIHHPADDLEAIKLSIQYLISSVADPGRGQGLSTTIEEITGLGGKVVVRSGRGSLCAMPTKSSAAVVPGLAGTLVGIAIPLHRN